MTSVFLHFNFVRLKSRQSHKLRIKYEHLKGVTAIHWKNTKHVRTIHISIL